MPYIITTSENVHGDELCVSRDVVSRRAVATLDEAHDYIGTMTDDDALWNEIGRDLHDADGGTIGPLPNGTIIAVRPTDWVELGGLAGWPLDFHGRARLTRPSAKTRTELLDAYNAQVTA